MDKKDEMELMPTDPTATVPPSELIPCPKCDRKFAAKVGRRHFSFSLFIYVSFPVTCSLTLCLPNSKVSHSKFISCSKLFVDILFSFSPTWSFFYLSVLTLKCPFLSLYPDPGLNEFSLNISFAFSSPFLARQYHIFPNPF